MVAGARRDDRPTVGLLLPVLNEIDGLKAIVPRIDRSLFAKVLVIDGGSWDGSPEWCRDQGLDVVQQNGPGLSNAIFTGIEHCPTEYVIEFSPDGNCVPEDLRRLVEALPGHDLVVVSRYLGAAYSQDDSWLTGLGNWVFTRLMRLIGDYPITDGLTMFRGFKRSIALEKDFRRRCRGPVFEPLVTCWCLKHRLDMHEIPGIEPQRIGGKRKMRPLYNGSCVLRMIFGFV